LHSGWKRDDGWQTLYGKWKNEKESLHNWIFFLFSKLEK
jgi:hypothetical protein